MDKKLFKPKKIDLPENLLLIPHFWDRDYYNKIKLNAKKRIYIAQSEILVFREYSLLTGFLGYSNLLTILEFINCVRRKKIFFLGTAGSLNYKFNNPSFVNVVEIYSSSIFRLFSKRLSFELKSFDSKNLKRVKGVSIDLIQRETPKWLKKQLNLGIDIVEMELFPLRVYLKKSFFAIVVMSDIVKPEGIEEFPDKNLFKEKFVEAFKFIKNQISKNLYSILDNKKLDV